MFLQVSAFDEFFSFYMNYVGCKVLAADILRRDEDGFIWTMWDVKCFAIFVWLKFNVSFIWTMWDVKAEIVDAEKGMVRGFIWTMWDVKAWK